MVKNIHKWHRVGTGMAQGRHRFKSLKNTNVTGGTGLKQLRKLFYLLTHIISTYNIYCNMNESCAGCDTTVFIELRPVTKLCHWHR